MSTPTIIEQRMAGFYQILSGARNSGSGLSSATKGNEREFFLTSFMQSIFPQTYRFGTGDIIDSTGLRSGQIDVVAEYPFLPSFPVFGKDSPRLYLADGVALVLEIKSNLVNQWDEVVSTCNQLQELSRDVKSSGYGALPGKKIPLIAVGFNGWKTKETILDKLNQSNVDAILSIEGKLFGNKAVICKEDKSKMFPESVIDGDLSLWEFTKYFHKRVGSIASMNVDIDKY